jgi:sugar lactone lactonase YvrE
MAAAISLLMLTCGTPSHAWCANLWVTNSLGGGGVGSFTSKQLAKSGMRAPKNLGSDGTTGLAFDRSKNLWVVIYESREVVRFTAAQLKNLKTNPSPTPGVIITSTSKFINIYGCNFDQQGNLWVVDYSNDSIDELSKAQLAAGSGNVTPAIVITSADLDGPNFLTFDKGGNAWVDNETGDTIAEFSASQLTSGGSKSATVLISDDGSGTSLDAPGEIAFDKKGNLWVPNYNVGTVVEYAKGQLTSSGNPAPTVKLSSAIFDGPWGAVFDAKGNLVVEDYNDGTIAKFTPKQLKVSGATVPKVSVTVNAIENYQIIFGPAS